MLTPRFELSQTASHVRMVIHAPFTHLAETTIFFCDTQFIFHSKPYYLRLHLPRNLVDSDLVETSVAEYVADDNSFVVNAPKAVHGEFFPDLDCISLLLRPNNVFKEPKHIEIVNKDDNEDDNDDNEWLIEQQLPPDPTQDDSILKTNGEDLCGYGFGYAFSEVFTKVSDECGSILDVVSPDSKSFSERLHECRVMELEQFDAEHYLADLMQTPDDLKLALEYENKYSNLDKDKKEVYSEDEQIRLMNARGKDLLPSSKSSSILLALIDLLFASSFDLRQNCGERSSESAWNIAKLSAFISCCTRFNSIEECVQSGLRRSLCFALFRHYELALKSFYDVVDVLKGGRIRVIKALLALMPLMTEYEGRFIINQIIIEPYVVWLQRIKETRLSEAAEKVKICLEQTTKECLELGLEEIEALVRDEKCKKESDISKLTEKLKKVYVKDSDDDSSDDEENEEKNGSSCENSSEESSSEESSSEESSSEESDNTEVISDSIYDLNKSVLDKKSTEEESKIETNIIDDLKAVSISENCSISTK